MVISVNRTALLVIAHVAMTAVLVGCHRGITASNDVSGRSAAYAAAILELSRDMGHRLAEESKGYKLFHDRDRSHSFGESVGVQIADIWLRTHPNRIRRCDHNDGGVYACEVFIDGVCPDLDTVRRDLLVDEVLSDRRIHPLVLCEITADGDELDTVLIAFVNSLASPALSDYFISEGGENKITSFSPRAAYCIDKYPQLLVELPPDQLFRQLRKLPGNPVLMKALVGAAKADGRTKIARWLGNCTLATVTNTPKTVAREWPCVLEHAQHARDFVTPELMWFYEEPRIFAYGSSRLPDDDFYARGMRSENDRMYYDAYTQYLRSITLGLSYDACLGASRCASRLEGHSSEMDFFLLQAFAIDKDGNEARKMLREREDILKAGRGLSDD